MRLVLPFIIIAILLVPALAVAQVPTEEIDRPKDEFRSVWLTTVFGLDWPKSTNEAQQQQSLRVMLDRAKSFGMNAVVFQVVSRGDAIYYSDRLPFPRYFTGSYGQRPSYDPLQFLIDEARERGLEVHAWFNAFNIGQVADTAMYATSPDIPHVYHENRDWVRIDGTGIWLNPGIPAAREWHIGNLMEMVRNYDIDAVHYDFIRYPGPFADDFIIRNQYYPENTGPIANWRRDMVTAFVEAAYDSIQAVKPWVKVGATPIGHYNSSGGWGFLSGFGSVFQDSRRWLQEGIVDYIAPQLYWDIGGVDAPQFDWLVRDWMADTHDRHIYIGMGPNKTNVFNEMPRQIDSTRYHNAHGQIQFRFESLTTNPNFSDRYQNKALVPTMPWLDSQAPPTPLNASITWSGESNVTVELNWDAPDYDHNGDTLLRYIIYRTDSENPATVEEIMSDPANIVDFVGGTSFTQTISNPTQNYRYYVTAANRNYEESAPVGPLFAEPVSVSTPEIAGAFSLDQNYPNPFNPTTAIRFNLPEAGHTELRVYDISGRLISTIVSENLPAGQHTFNFNGQNLASGLYIYRLSSGSYTDTRKMTLIK